jgi:hypothetical protein
MPRTSAVVAAVILATSVSSARAERAMVPALQVPGPPRTLQVTVNEDGSFTPQTVRIYDGDTVVWSLFDRTDAVVQSSSLGSFASWTTCLPPKAWEPADVNNLAGPMPEGVSGLFTAAPYGDDHGFERTAGPCSDASDPVATSPLPNPDGTFDSLCATGPLGATMLETWESSDITGVHIRLLWNQIQPEANTFFFDDLARELDNAVAHGKLYSLSIKAGKHGTPDWIFSTQVDPRTGAFLPRRDAGPVTRLRFRDAGDDEVSCGSTMYLGNPTEQAYEDLWNAMLTEVASFIKSRADWYRALAYTRVSGANLFSAENRLPNHCKRDCEICNTEVWARAGYTPTKLYGFYERQEDKLAELFPGKTMTYQLIQGGFPRVSDTGCWMVGEGDDADTVCPVPAPPPFGVNYVMVSGTDLLPGGTRQTTEILDQGIQNQGTLFHVQHNGVGIEPEVPADTCPNYQTHPAVPPAGEDYAVAGTGCPNHWVLERGVPTAAGGPGQLTGFQTNNDHEVLSPSTLDSTLLNAWDSSDAGYLEIYEQRHWEAQRYEESGVVQASGNTLAQWTEKLHRRRRNQLVSITNVPDPFPTTYSYTFHKAPESVGNQTIYYYNPSKCGPGNPKTGVVVIEPF